MHTHDKSGDSGAPKIAWVEKSQLAIHFPMPERIKYGDPVNFGYSDETVWPLKYALKKISQRICKAIRRNRYFGLFRHMHTKKNKS